jgi:hypothetical protein
MKERQGLDRAPSDASISSGAAPRPAAARLLLPVCGTLDRFPDRARTGRRAELHAERVDEVIGDVDAVERAARRVAVCEVRGD